MGLADPEGTLLRASHLSLQKSYVEAPSPIVMVVGDGACGR